MYANNDLEIAELFDYVCRRFAVARDRIFDDEFINCINGHGTTANAMSKHINVILQNQGQVCDFERP